MNRNEENIMNKGSGWLLESFLIPLSNSRNISPFDTVSILCGVFLKRKEMKIFCGGER